MQTTTLSFANIHNHGELFANMLRARRELFIVHNKWDLPEALGMEYDQYDTPASRWVVVHDEFGRVLAGNRLTPTTTRCGIYSYMIRDAQRGLLTRSRRICFTNRRRWPRRSGKARGCSWPMTCRLVSGAASMRS